MKLGYSWEVFKEKMCEQALTTDQSTALSVFDNDFQEFMDKFLGTDSMLGLPIAPGASELDKSNASDYIKKVARKGNTTLYAKAKVNSQLHGQQVHTQCGNRYQRT